jgi:phenylacetate-coenzyme A ligase PaaK-like adenylate-forming protein
MSKLDDTLAEFLELDPKGLTTSQKHEKLLPVLDLITEFHYNSCSEYRNIVKAVHGQVGNYNSLEELPFLPVRLFKELDLLSVEKSEIIKQMHSSGTTGNNASRIYLDRKTIAIQTKVLSRIVGSKLGQKRLPMIVLDSESTITSRNTYSARAAGILGFSTFSSSRFFALDETMNLRANELKEIVSSNLDKKFMLFGFTYMVWQHFIQELIKSETQLDLSGSILIHGGGWKKLTAEYQVSNEHFKNQIRKFTNISDVTDYYGMVEQTGSLYFECSAGNLHSSLYSEVIFRDPQNLQPLTPGETGLIQVCSIVALSYPGHVLLTEDLGTYLGDDDCPCGGLGRYFQIVGRIAQAEIRGCSDTYKDGLAQ